MLLDAGAGSGKTSVLVERFVARGARGRHRGLGDPRHHVHREGGGRAARPDPARACASWAPTRRRGRPKGRSSRRSTASVRACCARSALAAGLDPAFAVLDQPRRRAAGRCGVRRRARGAAPVTVRAVAVELIAAYRPAALRAAILASHAELRSRGRSRTRACRRCRAGRPRSGGRCGARAGRRRARLAELGRGRRARGQGRPGARARSSAASCWIDRRRAVAGRARPLGLPGGNGAALSTPACAAYTEALGALPGGVRAPAGPSRCSAARPAAAPASARATRSASASAPGSTSRTWSC